MTTVDPEWDDDARAQALALELNQKGLCPCGCGELAVDSQNPDNEFAYEADGPYRCHARTTISKAQAGFSDADQQEALLWGVRLKNS